MYDIDISDSQQEIKVNESFLREVITHTLKTEQVVSATISIAIVDNPAMRELNRRHLNHDYDTDVLSFLLDCHQAVERNVDDMTSPRGAGKQIDGEVVISAEMACNRAAEFNWRPEDEFVLYLVHGLLHLMGYDDGQESETALMRSREQEILAKWKLSPKSSPTSDDAFSKRRTGDSRRLPGAK